MCSGLSQHALLSIASKILFVINFETFPTTEDMDRILPAIEQSFLGDANGKFLCNSPSEESNDEILPSGIEREPSLVFKMMPSQSQEVVGCQTLFSWFGVNPAFRRESLTKVALEKHSEKEPLIEKPSSKYRTILMPLNLHSLTNGRQTFVKRNGAEDHPKGSTEKVK